MSRTDTPFSIAADFDNLTAVKAFVCRRAEELAVPDLLWSKLELVVEEIFLNIVNHAQPKIREEVEILCSVQGVEDTSGEMFCIAVRDWGPSFNPLEKEDPTLEQDVDSRPIGGLGIFLVLQMSDHCTYTRENESNLLTVCFQTK